MARNKTPMLKARIGALAVTPKSLSSQAAKRVQTFNIALGTSTVTTQTVALGILGVAGKVQSITYASTSTVTGTTITAEVKKNSADGNTPTTLQSAATDIKITSSTDTTPLAAALTATTADLTVTATSVLTCVITCSSVTAGPGFLSVTVVFAPSEDTGAMVSTGESLL